MRFQDRLLMPPAEFAVVGTGAAALGVLSALIDQEPLTPITLIDIGKDVVQSPDNTNISAQEVEAFYAEIYEAPRALGERGFPPAKTQFGRPIEHHPSGQGFLRSEIFGGMTNYWGATMLPFTSSELASWPIDGATLSEQYRTIAEIVGISGRYDQLNDYFATDYSNRPPIRATTTLQLLNDAVNDADNPAIFRVRSGLNRCAVETRKGHARACLYCGECMAGCFRDAVYSSRMTIGTYLRQTPNIRLVKGKVRSIRAPGRITVQPEGKRNDEILSGFARIFICAGCVGSSEIILRSAGLSEQLTLSTNSVMTFPILYLGAGIDRRDRSRYLALSNLIMACIPDDDPDPYAQLQVYPNSDYIYRAFLSDLAWIIARPFIGMLRSRLHWGRLFIHGDRSQKYKLSLHGSYPVIEEDTTINNGHVNRLMTNLRRILNTRGFWVPPIKPLVQKCSAHYGATLPFGNSLIELPATGEIFPETYLCDSSCFPDLPAVSPTFTIMANARRIALDAVNG